MMSGTGFVTPPLTALPGRAGQPVTMTRVPVETRL